MPLNPDAAGNEGDPVDVSWDSKDALLYAVGVGAGTDEHAFTTENTNGAIQRVLPTFPVIIGWGSAVGSALKNAGTFNPAMVVHGTQAVTLHSEVPVEGKATLTSAIVAMYDKEKGRRSSSPRRRRSATASRCTRCAARSSSAAKADSAANVALPARRTCHSIGYPTRGRLHGVADASAYLSPFRRSRPLALRSQLRRPGRLRRPILHGLCSYGFTGRALLHAVCSSDPARFRHIEGRFASPVLPGDTLTVRAWETGDGEAVFVTSVDDRPVVDQGLLRFN